MNEAYHPQPDEAEMSATEKERTKEERIINRLVTDHIDTVRSIANRFAYPAIGLDADELFSIGLVKLATLAQSWVRTGEEGSFRNKLITAVRNCFIDETHNRQRRPAGSLEELTDNDASGVVTLPTETPGPEELIISEDQTERLEQVIARLSKIDRQIISCRLADMSVEEISRRLGIPKGTVKSRVFRAIVRLRALLDQYDPEFKAD